MMESSTDVLNLLRGIHSPGEGPQSGCTNPGSMATGSALLGGGLACSPIPWRVRGLGDSSLAGRLTLRLSPEETRHWGECKLHCMCLKSARVKPDPTSCDLS